MTQVKVEGKLHEFSAIRKKSGVVLPLVQAHLLAKGDHDHRDARCVHPSEMAKADWCHRATYFRIARGTWPSEDKFNFVLQNIFAEGNSIHAKWQRWLAETDKLWGDWECAICGHWAKAQVKPAGWCARLLDEDEHPAVSHIWEYREVGLSHGLISGREDAGVGSSLVEFKSIGIGTLRFDHPDLLKKHYVQTTDGKKLYDLDAVWKGLIRPLKPHLLQANIYLWLAWKMGLDCDTCSIVYEYKFNQQVKEYTVRLRMDLIQPLLDMVAEIDYALKGQRLPPTCRFGGCSKCEGYDANHDSAPEAGVHRGSARQHSTRRTAGNGTGATTEAGIRDSETTPRHHRSRTQCPDDAVPEADGVAELRGRSGSDSRGGRAGREGTRHSRRIGS
jgi:hypothetical protein